MSRATATGGTSMVVDSTAGSSGAAGHEGVSVARGFFDDIGDIDGAGEPIAMNWAGGWDKKDFAVANNMTCLNIAARFRSRDPLPDFVWQEWARDRGWWRDAGLRAALRDTPGMLDVDGILNGLRDKVHINSADSGLKGDDSASGGASGSGAAASDSSGGAGGSGAASARAAGSSTGGAGGDGATPGSALGASSDSAGNGVAEDGEGAPEAHDRMSFGDITSARSLAATLTTPQRAYLAVSEESVHSKVVTVTAAPSSELPAHYRTTMNAPLQTRPRIDVVLDSDAPNLRVLFANIVEGRTEVVSYQMVKPGIAVVARAMHHLLVACEVKPNRLESLREMDVFKLFGILADYYRSACASMRVKKTDVDGVEWEYLKVPCFFQGLDYFFLTIVRRRPVAAPGAGARAGAGAAATAGPGFAAGGAAPVDGPPPQYHYEMCFLRDFQCKSDDWNDILAMQLAALMYWRNVCDWLPRAHGDGTNGVFTAAGRRQVAETKVVLPANAKGSGRTPGSASKTSGSGHRDADPKSRNRRGHDLAALAACAAFQNPRFGFVLEPDTSYASLPRVYKAQWRPLDGSSGGGASPAPLFRPVVVKVEWAGRRADEEVAIVRKLQDDPDCRAVRLLEYVQLPLLPVETDAGAAGAAAEAASATRVAMVLEELPNTLHHLSTTAERLLVPACSSAWPSVASGVASTMAQLDRAWATAAAVQLTCQQLLGALARMHTAHGIVHCDVKDSNVMRDARGDVMLIDFGSALRGLDVTHGTVDGDDHGCVSSAPDCDTDSPESAGSGGGRAHKLARSDSSAARELRCHEGDGGPSLPACSDSLGVGASAASDGVSGDAVLSHRGGVAASASKERGAGAGATLLRVRAADVCGTRGYTAPELGARRSGDSDDEDSDAATEESDGAGAEWVDERIDAFSAGVTLHNAFAELIRAARSEAEAAEAAASPPHGVVSRTRPRSEDGDGSVAATVLRLCDNFDELVTQLTAKDPTTRLSVADAMATLTYCREHVAGRKC